MSDYEQLLLDSFKAVTLSAHPQNCIGAFIPLPPKGRLIVIGAGKASAAMAAAFEESYNAPLEGLVVTRYGYDVPIKHIKIVQAAHPVPDEAGQQAVQDILSLIASAGPDDLIVCLISGGGSALLSSPVDGVSFEELQALNKQLLKSGAPIHDMNIVRKHLNRALGGGLAMAARNTRMVTLAISDVTGDDPAIIASGATVADPSTLDDAKAVLEKYEIKVPQAITDALNNTQNETPKPADPIFENNEYHLIATPAMALNAAQNYWQDKGFATYVLGAEMQGDTNECAAKHIAFINDVYGGGSDIKLPCALLSGGETTVKVTGSGQGGPNTQFMLQAALLLQGNAKVYAMGCDTDGIDGSADNAGAMISPLTLTKAKAARINANESLGNNDAYHFFKTLDDLVMTGATFTNVNDYRVFLLLP